MRKYLWVGWMAAAVLAGCAEDDSADSEPSGFSIGEEIVEDAGGEDAGADVQVDAGVEDTSVEPGEALGEACGSEADCADARCLTGDDFPRGYCSTEACESSADCPDDALCLQAAGESFCAAACDGPRQCRDGYTCVVTDEGGACGPIPQPEPPVELRPDGAPCDADEACAGGTCILGDGWADGYCTTLQCEDRTDCARGPEDAIDNRCYRTDQPFCVRMCSSEGDCRDGYDCYPAGGGQGFCAPSQSANFDFGDLDRYPFDITCGVPVSDNVATIDFEVAPSTTSYMVTPFTTQDRRVFPLDMTLPDGGRVDFRGENGFQLATAQLFEVVSPLVIPAIEPLSGQMQPGRNRLRVQTDADELCYYTLEESSPGTQIDLNIYLVGVPGVDASSAAADADFQATLGELRNIYSAVGFSLGEVDYIDVTGAAQTEYSVIRSQLDVENLVAESTLPPGGADDALSANIFFVRGMELGGAIGISMGLPGPAALHGTPASGVVFTSEYMGRTIRDSFSGDALDGNEFTGLIIAHELGHYLGLFHTSEQDGRGFDPLDDTARCSQRDFPTRCPDLNNLMFPLAGAGHTEITAGQLYMMQANPLTKD